MEAQVQRVSRAVRETPVSRGPLVSQVSREKWV